MTKREQYRREIASWRESGKTQAAYCRERNLSAHTFSYHLACERQEAPKAQFVEVGERAPEGYVELRYGETVTIRLPLAAGAKRIAELARCLA